MAGDRFTVPGHCVVCHADVGFLVDYVHCWRDPAGRRIPNWRERMFCPQCWFNARMRAAFGTLLGLSDQGSNVYLTERVTPFYERFRAQRPRTVGSEFLRDGTPPGKIDIAGVRHEDVTCLTFPDRSFDLIGSFEVLEHVPNYTVGLVEFFRCLKPGGSVVITVPMDPRQDRTTVRATQQAEGRVTHILPPEIHGDPLDGGGALSFYLFGWDFVDALRDAGFEDAALSLFWSAPLGYLGGYQSIITARRPGGDP